MAKSGGATEKTNLFYPFHSPKLTFENTLLYDSLFFLYHTKSDEASSLSLEKSLRGYHHLKINQACFLNRFGAHRSHHCTVRLSSLKPEQQQLGKQLCKHCVLWAADGEASYPVLKCRDLNCTQSSVTAYMGKETKRDDTWVTDSLCCTPETQACTSTTGARSSCGNREESMSGAACFSGLQCSPSPTVL